MRNILMPWIHSRRWMAICYDIVVIPIAWFLAFSLRFNLDGIPPESLKIALEMFPTMLCVQIGAYWTLGLYRGIWQFASLPDLLRILKAVILGCSASFIVLYLVTQLQGFPRSVLPIYGMLLILLLGGGRFCVRWLKETRRWMLGGKKVLVVGAGRAGEGIVRELLRDNNRGYKPIAFVDDKRSKQKQDIHGIRVVGRCKDIPKIVKEYGIDLIIIAVPSAKAQEMRRIMQFCERVECAVHTLPGINDIVSGRVSIDLLREVSLEDLLGRSEITLDWDAISASIQNKTVLVSGGGGSIGSELCRQIARLNPEALIVIDHSEYNVFMLQQEFIEQFPNVNIAYHLIDVCDKCGLRQILENYKPDIIFHAAAYKHVPLLEGQPREAILNNIMGTRSIAEAAIISRVSKFVLVSSDKAVNPTNVMGATKRVSEMICHHFNSYGVTQFITVRFGNVLGSAGSVVPIFKQQLEKGGPLKVTHPEITRYFMTIPEACQLILQAEVLGSISEIYVLDMGEPIKIKFLAEQMIRLAGLKPNEDIRIEYTGLRPGEKLFEELFHPNEKLESTEHQKIFKAGARQLECHQILSILDALNEACSKYDTEKLMILLHQLVPELETADSVALPSVSSNMPAIPIM